MKKIIMTICFVVCVVFIVLGVVFAEPQKNNSKNWSVVANEKKVEVRVGDKKEEHRELHHQPLPPPVLIDPIINQINAVSSLDFWNERVEAYIRLATRPDLHEYAQIVLINQILGEQNVPFSEGLASILISLIDNPVFSPVAKEKITQNLKLIDEMTTTQDLQRVLKALDARERRDAVQIVPYSQTVEGIEKRISDLETEVERLKAQIDVLTTLISKK